MNPKEKQQHVLNHLLETAADTEYGKNHDFGGIDDYGTFRDRLPVTFYEDIALQIERLKQGASGIYWPGTVSNFAVSSGTSGEGKHLPVTEQRLRADHRFMWKLVWSYLKQRPNIFRLAGRHASLPGSIETRDRYSVGEISAFTAGRVAWWLSPFQLIPPETMIRISFEEKIERLVEESPGRDIRVITCVPSWLLTLFQRVLQKTGAGSVREIWPNLSLLVCGGVKLSAYRTHLEKLIGDEKTDFIETYGASEGYFSYTDDLHRTDMRLVTDNGIFYEFIPDPLPGGESLAIQETLPLWDVEPDIPYAVLVSTNAGLWRYALNDIIAFTRTDTPRIRVMGRVSEMLDEFGEAVYAYEAEEALRTASSELGIDTGTFAISASLSNEHRLPRHYWFVQVTGPVHQDTLDRLASSLDTHLRNTNRHYAIRRQSGALDNPVVRSITQKQINRWLEHKGRGRAQGKLPAVLKDEEDAAFFR